MKKICVKCGAEFEATSPYQDKFLCDACAAQSANRTVLRDRVCVDCGVNFVGYPRSLRCPDCNAARKAKQAREYAERRKMGATRKLGSVDYCQNCGKPYIVASGAQRYCPECAPTVVREHVLAQTRAWKEENFDNQRRQQNRNASVAEIPCAVCGKMFKPHSRSTTCSPECMAALQKQQNREWEQAHSTERNAYHRQQRAAKLAAMTEEERAAYREKVNARARENYKKRKERGK